MLVTPFRRDVVSNKPYPKSELIRLVRKGKEIVVDPNSSLTGRGAYLKYEPNMKPLELSKGLSRSYKKGVSEEEAAKILKEIEDGRK